MKTLCAILFLGAIGLCSNVWAQSTQGGENEISKSESMGQSQTGDAEALGLVTTIDKNEIAVAGEAATKQVDPKIKEYATMLHKQHTDNLMKGMKIAEKSGIQPATTPAVVNLRDKGDQDLAKLRPLEGEQFASAYVTTMIQAHTEALALLDSKLNQVQNEDLRKFLTETRAHVAMHLDKAKDLQTEVST
jgi:putative membrane protein